MSKKKISRNDPCSCGSGKKYKKCCESSEKLAIPSELSFIKNIDDAEVYSYSLSAVRNPQCLKSSDFWNGLGQLIGSLEKHQSAKIAFEKALLIDPDNSFAKLNLAVTYNVEDEHEYALRTIESVPDGFPRKAVIKANLFRSLERFEEAIPYYEIAIKEEPDFSLPYINVIDCMESTGNPLREFWLECAIEKFPKDPAIVYIFVKHLYFSQQFDRLEALDWIKDIKFRKPTYDIIGRNSTDQQLQIQTKLWQICGGIRKNDDQTQLRDAIELIESLEGKDETCILAQHLTILSSNLGFPDYVSRFYKLIHDNCRKKEYGVEPLEVYIACAYTAKGDNVNAMKMCEEYLSIDPEKKEVLNSYWWVLDEVGEIEKALTFAEKLYKIDPCIENLGYNLGYLCERNGRLGTAKQYYLNQINRKPNHWPAFENTCFLALLEQDFNEAQKYFDQTVSSAGIFEAKFHGIESDQLIEVSEWISVKTKKFKNLLNYAQSIKGDPFFSRKVIEENNSTETIIGCSKNILPSSIYSIEEVINALEDHQNQHSNDIRLQFKMSAHGDQSIIVTSLTKSISTWDKLPEVSKSSLIESEKRYRDGQTYDFAPVVVCFAKSIEVLLKQNLFNAFRDACLTGLDVTTQLNFALKDEFSKVHKFVFYINRGQHIEFGGMIFLLRLCNGKTAKKVKLLQVFKDFIENESIFSCFLNTTLLDQCEKLSRYRNAGAHEKYFDRDTATEVRNTTFSILNSL
jgi:tetratricopeptide (TPR) repeat protein